MTPEGQILRGVMDYLTSRRIFAMRMNTGAVASEYNGKKRFMRFGTPGCADVLAFPLWELKVTCSCFPGTQHEAEIVMPLWIECKAAKGTQSSLQKSFQEQVEREGHRYIVVRSVDELKAVL